MKKTKRFLTAALAFTMATTAITASVAATATPWASMDAVGIGEAALAKNDVLWTQNVGAVAPANAAVKSDAAYLYGTSWGVDSEADKTSVWSSDNSYLWGSLGAKGTHYMSKKFTPVAVGEALKFSTTFRLGYTEDKSNWYSMALLLHDDNDNRVVLLEEKFNNYWESLHLLSDNATAAQIGDASASYADSDVVTAGWVMENWATATKTSDNYFATNLNDDNKKFRFQALQNNVIPSPLDGDLTITLTAKPNATDSTKYDVVQVLSGANVNLTSTTTIDAAKIAALDTFSIVVADTNGRDTGVGVIGVKSVNAFQENTSGKETLALVRPRETTAAGLVTGSNADYLNGSKLGLVDLDKDGKISVNEDLTKIADQVKVEDGYIWGMINGHELTTQDKAVAKHFTPIADGETLEVSATIRMEVTSTVDYCYAAESVELTGVNGNLTLIQYLMNPYWKTMRFLTNSGSDFASGAANSDVTTAGTHRFGNETYGVYQNNINGNDIFDDKYGSERYMSLDANTAGQTCTNGGDLTLNLKAVPSTSDESKYDLILTTVGPNVNVTSTRAVDKNLVLGLSDFCLVSSRGNTSAEHATTWATPQKLIGLKNAAVSKTSGGNVSTGTLVTGTNTVYVPCAIPAGEQASFAIVAAVCDKTTDEQKTFFVKEYKNIVKTSENLAIDVEVSNPDTEYVKVYVFNSYDNLAPYRKPTSLGK